MSRGNLVLVAAGNGEVVVGNGDNSTPFSESYHFLRYSSCQCISDLNERIAVLVDIFRVRLLLRGPGVPCPWAVR